MKENSSQPSSIMRWSIGLCNESFTLDDQASHNRVKSKEMNTTEMIEKIAEKDFDLNEFVRIAITDENARNEIVHQMLTNSAIMVYYHCYYVVDKASQTYPKCFTHIGERLQHCSITRTRIIVILR